MSAFLPNTTTTDKYDDVILGSDGRAGPFDRGQLLIANNPVSLIVFRGTDRSSITPDEYQYVTPSLIPLVRGDKEYIFGVKIKSAIAGTPAQVSGFLVEPGVAGLGAGSAYTGQVSASGGVTPGQSSVQIQHNGALVGTEPIIDFVDANGLLWTITDDAANTRALVSVARELSYVQFAATATANTVAEAAALTIVTAAAVAFDGATRAKIEFYSPGYALGGADATHGISLWDNGADIGRLFDGTVVAASGGGPIGTLCRELVPAAGNHTYSVRIWQPAATNFVVMAGAGGAGLDTPGFIRVSRAA